MRSHGFPPAFDADGDITQLKDANTNYQYTYNADDEVSTFADNGTTGLPLVTLTYGYDGDSNVTSVSDSLRGAVSYVYEDFYKRAIHYSHKDVDQLSLETHDILTVDRQSRQSLL